MKYAELYKNEIVQVYDNLPNSWNNISNLDALSDDQLKDLSFIGHPDCAFLPLEDQVVSSIDGFVEFNPVAHRKIGPIIEIQNDKVVAIWEAIAKTREELLVHLRKKRDYFLKISDWTQIQDVPLNEEMKEKWRLYRQELRDITLLEDDFIITLLNDPFNNNWPKTPTETPTME